MAGPSRCRSECAGAVERCRNPHRASRVWAEGRCAQVGGERRAGAPARPAGDSLEIPWVAAGAEVRVLRRSAVGELMHGGLPEDHRARLSQPVCGLGVASRDVVREEARAHRRPGSGQIDVVLDGDRKSVKRAEPLGAGERVVGGACLGACEIGRDRDERTDRTALVLDPGEVPLGQRERRDLASANAAHDVVSRQQGIRRIGHDDPKTPRPARPCARAATSRR